MPRRCSRETSPSTPHLPKPQCLLTPASKPDAGSHQPHERSLSPLSSGSSSLSSPRDSDDLSDPFQTEIVEPKRQGSKRTIEQVNSSDCEGPITRAAAKHHTSDKRRRVHFQAEVPGAKLRPSAARPPPVVFQPGSDASFRLTRKSIFGESDSSGKQKAWTRKYVSAQLQMTEAIQNLVSALGPDLGGSRASTPASFVSTPPGKRGRGHGRRGRGRGGRGGRGRGGGRAGRNGDSPEPPRKKIMGEAEREILAELKARQTELKRFFKEVGAQQNEALSLLATRDLGKIAKRSKAHEKVPEHQALLDGLTERKKEAEEFARGKYEYDLRQAEILLEAEREVIEQRFKTRCKEAKSEHHAGAQGDYLIAREAIQAMIDDNLTEPGSPSWTRMPRLHTFAEPGMVRGYSSQHITEETSLRRPLSSFDHAIRREIFDHEIISSTLFEALDKAPIRQAKDTSQQGDMVGAVSSPSVEDDEDPIFSIEALAAEAAHRLQKSNDLTTAVSQADRPQPTPAPLVQQDPGLGSWPLSRLADAAENESSRMRFSQYNQTFAPPMVPINPFETWLGFMPPPLAQTPRQPQTMPSLQWPSPMLGMPMAVPSAVQSQGMSPPASSNFDPSHPLPPPPSRPPPQLQPPPQFIQRHPVSMIPYSVQLQGQPPPPQHPPSQHPPPQHLPPQHPSPQHPPPPYPLPQHLQTQTQHTPKPHPPTISLSQTRQAQLHTNPTFQTLPPHYRSNQPDQSQPNHFPVTFVNQTIVPPAPARATATATTSAFAKARKRVAAADRSSQRNNHNNQQQPHHYHQPHPRAAAGGVSSVGGGRAADFVALAPPQPPPKGGQRILLPKSG